MEQPRSAGSRFNLPGAERFTCVRVLTSVVPARTCGLRRDASAGLEQPQLRSLSPWWRGCSPRPRSGAVGSPAIIREDAGGPVVAAMYPSGVAYDRFNHRIVVADTGLDRIDIYDPDSGFPSEQKLGAFGTRGSGNGQLISPRQVAVDPATGDIYVGDAENNRIQKFLSDGTFVWATPGVGSCSNCMNTPIGVGSTPSTTRSSRARRAPIRSRASTRHRQWALDLAERDRRRLATRRHSRPDGRIWVADYHHHEMKAFTVSAAGVWNTTPDVTLGDGLAGGHALGELNFPYNVDFSPDGLTAYVADTGNSRVARWVRQANDPSDVTWTPVAPFATSARRRVRIRQTISIRSTTRGSSSICAAWSSSPTVGSSPPTSGKRAQDLQSGRNAVHRDRGRSRSPSRVLAGVQCGDRTGRLDLRRRSPQSTSGVVRRRWNLPGRQRIPWRHERRLLVARGRCSRARQEGVGGRYEERPSRDVERDLNTSAGSPNPRRSAAREAPSASSTTSRPYG